MKVSKIENGNFKELFKTPEFEFCGMMKQSSKLFLIKGISEYLSKMASGAVRKCPYEGVKKNHLQIKNFLKIFLFFFRES